MQTGRNIDTNTLLAIALVKIQDIRNRQAENESVEDNKQGVIVSS